MQMCMNRRQKGKKVGISSVQMYETSVRKAEKSQKEYKNIRSRSEVMSEAFSYRLVKMSCS